MNDLKIELIYDADCPNVERARETLRAACAAAGVEPRWSEWNRSRPDAPARAMAWGSPTILVDGRDVDGAPADSGGASCRVYVGEDGAFGRVPPAERVAAAIREAGHRGGFAWPGFVASGAAAGAALLPVLGCPACWPAYAGLLGAFGLGFLIDADHLLWLTSAAMGISLGALAFRARRRRGYGPLALGVAAAAAILGGKFAWDSDAILYGGIAVLVGASIRNGWPRGERAAPGAAEACGCAGGATAKRIA